MRWLLTLALVAQLGDSTPRLGRIGSGSIAYQSRMGQVTERPASLLFDFGDTSALANLPAELCINGVCVEPTCRIRGADATTSTWPAWGYGSTLTAGGTGGTADVDYPLLDSVDGAFDSAGTRHFADASTDCDLGTEDFVIETFLRVDTFGTVTIAGRSNGAGSGGWELLALTAGGNNIEVRNYDSDSNSSISTLGAGAMVAGVWYHAIFFMDRSGSGIAYINGAAGTAEDISGDAGTSTNALATTLFERPNTTIPSDVRLAYLALWKRSAWLDTHLQADLAKERFQRLTGTWPKVAGGSKVATTMTRSTVGYLRKQTAGVTTLFSVGANWLRVERNYLGTGYWAELVETNLALQSQDISTSWTKQDAGDTDDTDTIAGPNGETTADGSIADSTDGAHGRDQAITLTAAIYTFSTFAKAGDQDFAALNVSTITNAYSYFDLTDCSTGTKGAAAIESFAEDYGGGWCRIGQSYTGTAASHTHRYLTATADNDATFAGDGATVNTYWWGRQVEESSTFTSPIDTTTSTVQRSSDALVFDATGNVNASQGSLVCSFAQPSFDQSGTSGLGFGWGDGTNGAEFRQVAASDLANFAVRSASSVQASVSASSVDVSSATTFTASGSWRTDYFTIRIDGANVTEDVSGAAPASAPSGLKMPQVVTGPPSGVLIKRCRMFDVEVPQ